MVSYKTVVIFCFHRRFNPAELAFLTEYAAVMSPVAKATDVLQAEANAQMGWLLPTINLLTAKLDRVKLPLKYCKPLVDALQVTFILVFYLYRSILAYLRCLNPIIILIVFKYPFKMFILHFVSVFNVLCKAL